MCYFDVYELLLYNNINQPLCHLIIDSQVTFSLVLCRLVRGLGLPSSTMDIFFFFRNYMMS